MTVGNKVNSSKHTAGGFKWDPSNNDKSNLEKNQREREKALLIYRYKAVMKKQAEKNERH